MNDYGILRCQIRPVSMTLLSTSLLISYVASQGLTFNSNLNLRCLVNECYLILSNIYHHFYV